MDKSEDTGAGWRYITEIEFEKYGNVVDVVILPAVGINIECPTGKNFDMLGGYFVDHYH